MKRTVAALLILAMLLPIAVLTGCGPDRGQGSVVCVQFINYLANEDYDSAYNLIADDLKKEEPPKATKGPTPGPGETPAPTAALTPAPTNPPTNNPTPTPAPTFTPNRALRGALRPMRTAKTSPTPMASLRSCAHQTALVSNLIQ